MSGRSRPETQSPQPSFDGPRQWESDDDIMGRLHRIRSYRAYILAEGPRHMLPTRQFVEGLLAQVGASRKLADVVFKGEFQSTEEDDIP